MFTLTSDLQSSDCAVDYAVIRITYSSRNYRIWNSVISFTVTGESPHVSFQFPSDCVLPPTDIPISQVLFTGYFSGYIAYPGNTTRFLRNEKSKWVTYTYDPYSLTFTIIFTTCPEFHRKKIFCDIHLQDLSCGSSSLVGVSSSISPTTLSIPTNVYCVNNSGSDGAYGGLSWSTPDPYTSYGQNFILTPTANPSQYELLITCTGTVSTQYSNTWLYVFYLGGALGETAYITVQNNTNGPIGISGFNGPPDNAVENFYSACVDVGQNTVWRCSAGVEYFGPYAGVPTYLNAVCSP